MSGSVTRTVRLDEELDRALQRTANDDKVTVNFLVNGAIRKYIEWDLPGEKIGTIDASMVVDRFVDEIDDQKLFELGRGIARDFVKPFVLYVFGEFSLDTSIRFFKRASRYANRFVFDDTADKENRLLVLRHAGGQKSSRYYEGLMKGVYGDLLRKQVKIECTDDLCIIQFEAP